MRVTSSMYYDLLYKDNNNNISNNLFDVNRQISSGIKIKYAKDDVRTFAETMRLDNELVTLNQIKSSTESGYKFSNQSDTVLNDFSNSLSETKTLLINAANDSNSDISLDAIAKDLRGLENHFKNLANTSIGGEYLFSGSKIGTKPITDDGTYMGNDGKMSALVSSGVRQDYNVSGMKVFLGEESRVNREVTSNIIQKNLSAKYPDYTDSDSKKDGEDKNITPDDTIRDLMGDSDNDIDEDNLKHHFYLRGIKSDGSTFNKHIKMKDDQSIQNLLDEIGKAYGNTPDVDLVNVTMNSQGQILVEDKFDGSSKLEFNMVGATDFDQDDGNDDADIFDAEYGADAGKITNLDDGETDFDKIIAGTSNANNSNLYVKEFVVSPYASSDANQKLDALNYDNTYFTKDGSKLTSNVTQVLKNDNSFISSSTKLSEVADLSQGTDKTLDGTSFRLVGNNIAGNTYDVQIDLKSSDNGGSTFSLDTDGDGNYNDGTYTIYNMNDPRAAVDADEMTYQQLMDVINMNITNNLPATDTADDYDQAIKDSNYVGGTNITYDGKLEFEDRINSDTKASLALYDVNSGDFSKDASVMTFNSNDGITVRDAKTDFFKTIDDAIKAVEAHKLYPDGKKGESRNVGIQNAIEMITNLEDHINDVHTTVGANSKILETSLERTETLELSTMTLRSSVIDTDLAEASLTLNKLNLNYEAMLSTVGKVSKLSLVNYL